MPTIKDILERTITFRAAAGLRVDLHTFRQTPDARITPIAPSPEEDDELDVDEDIVESNLVWSWVHDPADPAAWTDGTVRTRHGGRYATHASTVFKHVAYESVKVKTASGKTLGLPLTPKFASAVYHLPQGEVREFSDYWVLPHKTDASMLVLFAYELNRGELVPIAYERLERLGADLMPSSGIFSGLLDHGDRIELMLAPVRFLVTVSLTCCREKNDWEPGELLGVVRCFPHLMLTANVDLESVDTTVSIDRSPKSAHHGHQMDARVWAMVFADTNAYHGELPAIVGHPLSHFDADPPPLPLWDAIFDYYDTDAGKDLRGTPLKFVDPSSQERVIIDGIRRAARIVPSSSSEKALEKYYENTTTFMKLAGQGEFDNIHLAPTMKFTHETTIPPEVHHFDDIVMAPFCVHDCFHMHTRWGVPLLDPEDMPRSNRGFVGYSPNIKPGAPMVPTDQTVFVTVTSDHGFEYRAIAQSRLERGASLCFMHHGFGYAMDLWPTAKVATNMRLLEQAVTAFSEFFNEPMTSRITGPFGAERWSKLYWRLRFGGVEFTTSGGPAHWLPRIEILDLDKCRA